MTNRSCGRQARHAKLLAAGGLNPTEMNVGRSEAYEPSEYCSVGFAKWNVLPAVWWLLCGCWWEPMKIDFSSRLSNTDTVSIDKIRNGISTITCDGND